MRKLRVLLKDQLTHSISSLNNIDKNNDVILICELWEDVKHIKHHKKKIAFWFSAMRHFAIELKSKGYNVDYIKIDEPNNPVSLTDQVTLSLEKHGFGEIVVTFTSEYHVCEEIRLWEAIFSVPVDVRRDNRFLSTPKYFSDWANGKKQIRMEYFYRKLRKKYNILMKDNNPVGEKWNYDTENRKTPKKGIKLPKPYKIEPDEITLAIMKIVEEKFSEHFGDIEPFHFAVTRKQALKILKQFIDQRLFHFGDYQDAMIENEPWMYHSHISFYLNCGLLLPLECIEAAEKAYYQGKAPINSVEGFIRQIAGWREYIRGVYWNKMPQYLNENFLEANRTLPDFFWTAETKMNCLHQCIKETKKNAYAHHIQRLMVIGNFALISGLEPQQVNEWFWIVYADAYEWVELPNVSGMILFADGGYVASKPYAAGGSYINKMSNYCKNCTYDVKKKKGVDACPFNYLYWNFLAGNRTKLKSNPRMRLPYITYDKMTNEKKKEIHDDSESFLKTLK